jgi:hypothetical protein
MAARSAAPVAVAIDNSSIERARRFLRHVAPCPATIGASVFSENILALAEPSVADRIP